MCSKGEKEKPPASLISSRQTITLQVLKLSSNSYGGIYALPLYSLLLQTQTLAEFFLSLPVTKGEKSVTINGTWETWERGNLFTLVVHPVLIRLVPLILTFSH